MLTLFGFGYSEDGIFRAVIASYEEISGNVELVDIPPVKIINDVT